MAREACAVVTLPLRPMRRDVTNKDLFIAKRRAGSPPESETPLPQRGLGSTMKDCLEVCKKSILHTVCSVQSMCVICTSRAERRRHTWRSIHVPCCQGNANQTVWGRHIQRRAVAGAIGDPACPGRELPGCLGGWTGDLTVACCPQNASIGGLNSTAGRNVVEPEPLGSCPVLFLWRSRPREGHVCC